MNSERILSSGISGYFELDFAKKSPRLVPSVITVVIYVEVISVEVKSIALRVEILESTSSTC